MHRESPPDEKGSKLFLGNLSSRVYIEEYLE